MTTIAEKKVLDHLINKGAATKFELREELGCPKDHVQTAIAKLVSQGRVQATAARKKHDSNRTHVVFAALQVAPKPVVHKPAPDSQSLNVFEHGSLYNRVHELEENFARLKKTCTDLRADLDDKAAGLRNELISLSKEYVKSNERLNKAINYINNLDLARIRIDDTAKVDRARMDGFAARLIALEQPRPAVDPVYVEIEKDITDKLGGQVSPELLCTIINEAYAERTK